jgi:hypothetical protein
MVIDLVRDGVDYCAGTFGATGSNVRIWERLAQMPQNATVTARQIQNCANAYRLNPGSH